MKLSRLLAFTLACLCAGSIASTAFAAAPQKELNFGIISTESSQNLKSNWEPFLKRMEEETGIKMKVFLPQTMQG